MMKELYFPTPHLSTKLIFNFDGTILFSSVKNRVMVWDVDNTQFCYACNGSFISLAYNSQSFLTSRNRIKGQISLWDTQTGAKLPLQNVEYKQYLFYQRAILLKMDWDRLEIRDPLGQRPHQIITDQGWLASGAIAPNNHFLLLTYGVDRSYGKCIDLNTGEIIYEFKDNSWGQSPIYFSVEHTLLICNGHIHDLNSGDYATYLNISGSIFRVSPKENWLVAAASERGKYIYLVDIRQPSAKLATIKTSSRIKDIAFHPDGEHIASLFTNGEIQLWYLKTTQLTTTFSVPTQKGRGLVE